MKTLPSSQDLEKLKSIKPKEPKILKEFKEFINSGSAIDLAVGVVIGTAFKDIVNSFVTNIMMPVVSIIIGGFNFSHLSITVPSFAASSPATINYGIFIQSVVDLLAVSFGIFIVIRLMNKFRKKSNKKDKSEKKPSEDTQLLREIRDALTHQKPKKP